MDAPLRTDPSLPQHSLGETTGASGRARGGTSRRGHEHGPTVMAGRPAGV